MNINPSDNVPNIFYYPFGNVLHIFRRNVYSCLCGEAGLSIIDERLVTTKTSKNNKFTYCKKCIKKIGIKHL